MNDQLVEVGGSALVAIKNGVCQQLVDNRFHVGLVNGTAGDG